MKSEMKSPRRSESRSVPSNLTISARIIIGIAGPQKLEPKPVLIEAIHTAIEKIKQMAPSLQSTQLMLCILSTLTKNSDFIVAKEILKIPGSMLELIVPLKEESPTEYLERSASLKQFQDISPEAASVREIPAKTYACVESYVVDECDVLLAFWDDKSTDEQRGLGEVIDYARRNGCPLILINTGDQEQVTVELGHGLNARMFHDIDEYNSQRINAKKLRKALLSQRSFFVSQAERTRLPLDKLSVTLEYFLPQLVRADILALRFQRLHHGTGSLIYILAALAIFVAAFQSLFIPDRPLILIFELVLLLMVLAIFLLGQRQRWHNKWLDYRFLAERLRSALFMALVNAGMTPSRRPRQLPLAFPAKAWMVAAFSTVWIQRPRFKIDDSVLSWELRDFIVRAWIDDQILYHKGISSRYYRRHQYMVLASFASFALTIIFVLLYVVLRELSGVSHGTFINASGLMASFLPAVAASITAIRTHRDYLRNSRLSAGMARYLEEMKVQTEKAKDHEDFLGLAKEIEETMQRENQDWRVEIRFHKPAVPG